MANSTDALLQLVHLGLIKSAFLVETLCPKLARGEVGEKTMGEIKILRSSFCIDNICNVVMMYLLFHYMSFHQRLYACK